MQPDLIIKPVFAPFVIKPAVQFALTLVLCAAIAIELASINEVSGLMLPAILAILLFLSVGIHLAMLFVRFQKTSYSFYPDRIILQTGGLFDDRTVELQLKNITHVSTTIPFLENKFFSTGNVYIQAAGASGTEISMISIANPMSFYKEVAARMQKNGFSLTRKQEIQHEQPGFFGTVIQLGEAFTATVLVGGYFLFGMIIEHFTQDKPLSTSGLLSAEFLSSLLLYISLGTLFLGATIYAVLYALDLSRRNYILYDDVIDYSDGFLTQRHKFIPLENLADVTLTQSLLRRVFNYSDLVVSCQGADTNIHFKVMPRADQFKANLERLIREHKSHQPVHPSIPFIDSRQPHAQYESQYQNQYQNQHDGQINHWQTAQASPQPVAPQRRRATNRPELELRLSLKRAIGGTALTYGSIAIGVALIALLILPALSAITLDSSQLLPEFPVAGFSLGLVLLMVGLTVRDAVTHAIAYHATHYRMDDHKVGLHHTLFNKKHIEFTLDKITSISVSHTILDRVFHTATLQFHSIGTSEVIVFKHLDDGQAIANDILERLGFEDTQPTRTLTPSFSLQNVMRAHLDIIACIAGWTIISLIVAIFYPFFLLQLLLVSGLVLAQYSISEAFYQRTRLELFDDHLRLREGILTISSHYAAFHDIKHLHSTQYLNSQTGTLRWTIAGGTTQELAFLEDVSTQHEQLDALLYAHPIKAVRQPEQFTTTTLQTAKPELANSLTILLLTSAVLFPLLATLPVTLPILIIRMRTKQYTADSSRITSSWGRMYRHRQTILYNRIDHLTTSRDLLNNLFKNGNIGIATVGSTDTDLTLKNFKNHQEFYDTIKQNLPTER